MAYRIRLAIVRRILAAVCLATASGCEIDQGLTWLPDSSGFVFTDLLCRPIFHYDVQARQRRVVVENTGAMNKWPAVSPDGKEIAVARLHYVRGEPGTVEVIRYDFSGKERGRSPTLRWGRMHPHYEEQWENGLGWAALFWAPQGNKLLVVDVLMGQSAIYELANERLILTQGGPLTLGATPLRPDGKAFLLHGKRDLFVVDWEGKAEPVALPSLGEAASHNARQAHRATSRWQGNTLVISAPDLNLRIDTEKRTAKLGDADKSLRLGPHEAIQSQYAFPDGGVVVRVVVKLTSPGAGNHRLEVVKPNEAKPLVLSDKGPFAYFPSPNQEWVAVVGRMRAEGEKIRVINRKGELIAEVDRF